MEENYVEQTEVVEAAQVEAAQVEEVQVEQTIQESPKKRFPILLLIPIAAVAVVFVVAAILIFGALFNNYKTPVNLAEDVLNAKTYKERAKASIAQSNGLIEKEVKTIYDIYMDSEEMDLDELEEGFEEQIDYLKDDYGNNYKFYYVIEEKEALDKDELKEIKTEIKDFAKDIDDDIISEFEDYDSDDWEDAADDMGVSKAQAKKVAGALEDVYKELRSAKVTKGYELSVVLMVSGSELDEPEEVYDGTMVVCKVNGRWVCPDNLSTLAFGIFN